MILGIVLLGLYKQSASESAYIVFFLCFQHGNCAMKGENTIVVFQFCIPDSL